MAHFQERRTGSDRRTQTEKDRRQSPDRRMTSKNNDHSDIVEQARFNAWLVMTDKDIKN